MDFSNYRKNLVECQLYPNGIVDKEILNVFLTLPRENFFDSANSCACYGDEDVCVKNDRWALEPVIEALILHEGEFNDKDIVMIIGASSPTLPAYIAQFVTTVIVIDTDQQLLDKSQKACLDLEICNILFECVDDYTKGCPAQAPYDKIVFSGAVSRVNEDIIAQLTIDGRILAILREDFNTPGSLVKLFRADKDSPALSTQFIDNVNTPYLPGFQPESRFEF